MVTGSLEDGTSHGMLLLMEDLKLGNGATGPAGLTVLMEKRNETEHVTVWETWTPALIVMGPGNRRRIVPVQVDGIVGKNGPFVQLLVEEEDDPGKENVT
eukprot:GFUD01129910.1.p3 GENE.GFUD01129910.1~~GFUD01129910.1.p3  ORF type:complete len:100 (-),score=32.80 GFUD01129910.1:31-330(-)